MKNYCHTEHSSRSLVTKRNETDDYFSTLCLWFLVWLVTWNSHVITDTSVRAKWFHILIRRESSYEGLVLLFLPLSLLYPSDDYWGYQDRGLESQKEEHLHLPVCTEGLCYCWMAKVGHQRAISPPTNLSMWFLLPHLHWNWFSEGHWWPSNYHIR